jgi:hypothetical protein
MSYAQHRISEKPRLSSRQSSGWCDDYRDPTSRGATRMGGAAGGGTVIAMSVIAADAWDRSDWLGAAESAAPGHPGRFPGRD